QRAPRRGRARPGLRAGLSHAGTPLRRPGRSGVRRLEAGRRARRRGAAAGAGLPAGQPLPAAAPAPRRRWRRRRRARAGNARDLAPALALPRPEALTPMHPALSVILFTTLSGAGYGLLAWTGLDIALLALRGTLAPALETVQLEIGRASG